MTKPDVVGRSARGVYADGKSSESHRERKQLAVELEESFATHRSHHHVLGIHKLDSLTRVRFRVRLVDLHWRLHPQSLVGTTVVEVHPPQVTCALLLLGVGRGDPLDLQRNVAMHPLMRTVVGGLALPRSNMLDAQTHPPSGQLCEPKSAVRCHEGVAVVRQNYVRNAVELEQAFQN